MPGWLRRVVYRLAIGHFGLSHCKQDERTQPHTITSKQKQAKASKIKQASKQTTQTNKQTNKQTSKQAKHPTHKHTHTQTDTHALVHAHACAHTRDSESAWPRVITAEGSSGTFHSRTASQRGRFDTRNPRSWFVCQFTHSHGATTRAMHIWEARDRGRGFVGHCTRVQNAKSLKAE